MYRKFKYVCEDAKNIREEVFINEQHFIHEFDDIDNFATHLVLYEDEQAIATCRYYKKDNSGEFIVGRVAVRKCHRGKHFGEYLMKIAEQNIFLDGGTKIKLSAQLQIQPFYEKIGYKATGPVYTEEECPHIRMEKDLTAL
ncbi:MAG: GNAT family N-acetyltransferase [Bacteroidales bacterium]|nr:GNAT family N-acetyltransferase [Bacteroidales bacterium]